MKRWFVMLLALWLLIPAAQADEIPLSRVLPMVDQAAAAALEETDAYCGVRPMAIDPSEDGDAVRILGDVYLAQAQLDALTDEQYAQAEWLDRRAVVELRCTDGEWVVTSFTLDAEWEMEQVAQEYFMDTMMEYVNAEYGFSVQYPAVFGEEDVTVAVNGITGRTEKASFRVECLPNEENWTTETLLASKKQETSAGETNIDSNTGFGQLEARVGNEMISCLVVVTPMHVYQAELRYDLSLIRDFLHYSRYMMNSFSVDEMGLG